MDKRELLLATLRGDDTERIPCGFWHHFPKNMGTGIASVKSHVDFYHSIDADMVKIMNEHLYSINITVQKPEDWKKLKVQSFVDTPYSSLIDEIRAIKRALPSDVPIFVTVHGVMVSAYHATEKPGGFSNPDNMISRHLRENPETVAVGLQAITDTLIDLCQHIAAEGVDGIYYAALGGESYRFTPQIFKSYVKFFDDQVIRAINDLGVISVLHICKDQVRIPLYAEIPAHIVNWAIHDCSYGLGEGRKIFPDSTLLGGFDDRSGVIVNGSQSQIEQEVETIVSQVGRARFILGADCTLPDIIDTWRLSAVQNYARHF